MKLCRHVLIFLIAAAMATLPIAKTALAQEAGSPKVNQPITTSQPKMMATAEEPIPVKKKPTGKYILLGVLGVALVALAAGGGGGGGGDGTSTTTSDTGTVAVGW